MDTRAQQRTWLLVAVLALSTPVLAAPPLQCTEDAELEACTPQALWAGFSERYKRDEETGESKDWIGRYLTSDEQEVLLALLSPTSPRPGSTQLLTDKLPPSAALAWRLVTGDVSPEEAAIAARDIEDVSERLPLIEALTSLKPSLALAQALSWTLKDSDERDSTMPWLLQAKLPAAQFAVLETFAQCSREEVRGCVGNLPVGPYFSAAQLRSAWPGLSPDYQAALLTRVAVEESEPFLRNELLADKDGSRLAALWTGISPVDGAAAQLLARLILERLLDPEVAAEERFRAPVLRDVAGDSDLPYSATEIGAWRLLAHPAESESMPLWHALSRTRNPWTSLLGTAGLLAADRAAEAANGLLAVFGNEDQPPPTLVHLLKFVSTDAADHIYARALAVKTTRLEQACRIAESIEARRAKRLSAELALWAQNSLTAVDQRLLPGLEVMRSKPRKDDHAEPMRSIMCIGEVLVSASKIQTEEMRRLASWLDGQEAEIFRLMGVAMFVEMLELGPLERLVADTANESTSDRKEMHGELKQMLRTMRHRNRQRTPDPDTALATCREELNARGLDSSTVVLEAWEALVGEESPRVLLMLQFGADERAKCDVEFSPEPRVIRLEFTF